MGNTSDANMNFDEKKRDLFFIVEGQKAGSVVKWFYVMLDLKEILR